MSDKMRWRYGDTNPVYPAVDAETVIEIGDLLWQDTDDAKPAAAFVLETAVTTPSLSHHVKRAVLPERFTDKFLGVAMQRSRSGETTPIRVATTGVFEFDCPSGTFELGDLVGARCITAVRLGDSEVPEHKVLELENQEVAKVPDRQYAIARVAKREARPATSVLVDIRSQVMGFSV